MFYHVVCSIMIYIPMVVFLFHELVNGPRLFPCLSCSPTIHSFCVPFTSWFPIYLPSSNETWQWGSPINGGVYEWRIFQLAMFDYRRVYQLTCVFFR